MRLLLFVLMLLLLSALVWRYRDTSDEEIERALDRQSRQLLQQAEKAGDAARKTLRETTLSLDEQAGDLEVRTRHLRTEAGGFMRDGTRGLRERIEQVRERAALLRQQVQQAGGSTSTKLDQEAQQLRAEVEQLTREVDQALAAEEPD